MTWAYLSLSYYKSILYFKVLKLIQKIAILKPLKNFHDSLTLSFTSKHNITFNFTQQKKMYTKYNRILYQFMFRCEMQ
jgi:hypothetical protein